MKTLQNLFLAVSCLALLGFGTVTASAQGRRGNYDPAQMREETLTHYKEAMNVTDDTEWKVLSAAITKVMDAGQDVMSLRFSMMRNTRPQRTNDNNGNGGNERRRGGGMFGGTPVPELEDLQKAIDAKASKDELKAKMAKVREVIAAKDAKLASAQESLKQLLTPQQEAVALAGGLVK